MAKQKKTGIYKINNKEDGKIYIGQAKDIEKRWRDHKRTKYPEDKFTYEILMECDIISLNFWEIAWIASENACDPAVGYNQALGGSDLKCIFPSDETKAKLSAINKGKVFSEETRQKLSAAHKGKVLSEETKTKMSISKIGNKSALGIKRDPKIMNDLRALSIQKSSKACVINDVKYKSLKEASNILEIKYTTLASYMRSVRGWPDGMSGHYIVEKHDEQGTFNT